MYEGQLVDMCGHVWYYKHASQEKVLSLASKQMYKAGGKLRQEVDFHPGSFIFTDGMEIQGMLVIYQKEG